MEEAEPMARVAAAGALLHSGKWRATWRNGRVSATHEPRHAGRAVGSAGASKATVHGEGDACGAHALCEHLGWQRAEDERETRPPPRPASNWRLFAGWKSTQLRSNLSAAMTHPSSAAWRSRRRRGVGPPTAPSDAPSGRGATATASPTTDGAPAAAASGAAMLDDAAPPPLLAVGSVGAIVVGSVGDGEGKESLRRR